MKLKVKYLIVLGLMMAMAVISLNAEPVDTTTAKMMARNFFRSISPETSRSMAEPVIAYCASERQRGGDNQRERNYFYVVNLGQDGFVIIAADNRVSPILAYSTTSSFDNQQLPPNVAFMLDEYKLQMDEIDRQQIEATASVTAEWEALRHQNNTFTRNVEVGPLLTSKWAQSPYYNAMCPTEPHVTSGHALAGCTAVAMGQIMRYWRHPEHGVGSHSYVANNANMGGGYGNYGTLSADFANTYYDYDNMPDSLTANSTAEEVNAVATLLYHCGVSLDMAYGVRNSAAIYSIVDDALMTYFDYAEPLHVYRSVYSQSSWLNMMQNELDHLRPIFYTGASEMSAHAFVCDGYNERGFFHINWGWGGYADGYYLLSNLNPTLLTYNTSQTAIIHVEVEPQSMSVSEEELTFFVEEEIPAAIQRFDVQTLNIDSAIRATASGSFLLSADSVNFSSQISLPNTGGSVFVKYVPTLQQAHFEKGSVEVRAGVYYDTVRLVGVTYYPQCTSPLNLTAVQGDIDTDTNQVLLTWQPPVPGVVNFSWDSVSQSALGDITAYTMIPMHRMAVTDLLPYHRHHLTHISFIARPQVTEYRLLVYTGGRIGDNGRILDPGTLIYEQQVNPSSLTMGTWNTVALDSLIVIDGSKELWYGLSISATANSHTVVTGGEDSIPLRGNIYGYYYEGELTWYQYNRNFVMKAVIENPFTQYEIYRDGNSLATTVNETVYADYPPVYAHYTYEVKALWNNQCSSGISQTVNFRPPCHVVNMADYVTACDSFVWDNNDSTYYVSGEYLHEYFNADDCWQVDTLHLSIYHPIATVDSLTICQNDLPYTYADTIFGIETPSFSVSYFNFSTIHGCDSMVTLYLTVHPSAATTDTVTICASDLPYAYGDTLFELGTPAFSVSDIHFSTIHGCDSIVTLSLTVNPTAVTEDYLTICDNELPYTYADTVFETGTVSSDFIFHFSTVHACDSTVTLHLTVLPSSHRTDTVVSCQPYTWINGETYSESTDAPFLVYQNALGCDSVVTLHLIILQATEYIDTIVACDAYTWLDGNTYTESIVGPIVHFTDVLGCDNATVTLNLTILYSSTSEDTVEACDSYTWIDGVTYTESTDEATMVYTNAVGCDSVVTLHLTLYHSVQQADEQVACDSYTWVNGETYTESTNTPTITYTSSTGCDSVVTLNLTVNHSVSTEETLSICGSDLPYTYADTVFDETTPASSVSNFHFSTVNGCDSLVTLYLTVNPTFLTDEYVDITRDDLPYTYGDTIFDINTPDTSAFTFHFATVDGCDSIVTLHLTISVGIDEHQGLESFQVYPNPTTGKLTVNAKDLSQVQLFDIYGRFLQVWEAGEEITEIDLSAYAKGVYFVRILKNDKPVGVTKVVKQ